MDPDQSPLKKSALQAALLKERIASRISTFDATYRLFSPGERLVLYLLMATLSLSAFALLARANALVSVQVPAQGGTLLEGVVGTVRFVNPLLALSGPDKDLSALVYSGLTRATPEGHVIPDLANQYDISEDGTTYTFALREGLTFHDGTSITADDVVFTILRAQNPDFKSVHRADWEGVEISSGDERTIVFTLPHAYAPFLENTTIGILPKHLWENVPAEDFPFNSLNTHPIGSGPFKIESIDTNATGAATRYKLSSFKKFSLGEPYLRSIELIFYPNEESLVGAFNTRRIDSMAGISPRAAADITRRNAAIARSTLPRTFGVFFNQNKNAILSELAVRKALDAAIDKERIVADLLHGFGVKLSSPIPPRILGARTAAVPQPLGATISTSTNAQGSRAEDTRTMLSQGGWSWSEEEDVWKKKNTALSLTLVTADEPTLAAAAEAIARDWRAAGIRVEVHVYPLSEFNSVILRPRNYEAVLFGEVVGRALDLFAFWHSSQRNDPGLNLALYTSVKADRVLAEARATTNVQDREQLYEEFEEIVLADQPASFLFAPEFIYILPERLRGVKLGALTTPAERFTNVHEWHTDTEAVWSIFTPHADEE